MQFAVLFESRANTGIDRMKIINAVAKSVPGPHKVDLNHPDKTIVVEIIKVRTSIFVHITPTAYFCSVFCKSSFCNCVESESCFLALVPC